MVGAYGVRAAVSGTYGLPYDEFSGQRQKEAGSKLLKNKVIGRVRVRFERTRAFFF